MQIADAELKRSARREQDAKGGLSLVVFDRFVSPVLQQHVQQIDEVKIDFAPKAVGAADVGKSVQGRIPPRILGIDVKAPRPERLPNHV